MNCLFFSITLICYGIFFLTKIEAFSFRQNTNKLAAMECVPKYKVPAYDIENIKNRKLPESKEGKCFLACILKKLNVINKKGKFELKTVKGWINEKYKDDTRKLAKANSLANICAEQLPAVPGDECEYASKILECSKLRNKVKQ